MSRETYNFECYPDDESEEVTRLSYEIGIPLHISRLHRMCKTFAISLGFSPESVEEYFGESHYND